MLLNADDGAAFASVAYNPNDSRTEKETYSIEITAKRRLFFFYAGALNSRAPLLISQQDFVRCELQAAA